MSKTEYHQELSEASENELRSVGCTFVTIMTGVLVAVAGLIWCFC